MRVLWTLVAMVGVMLGGAVATEAQETGSLSGRITYAGTPPPRKKLDVTKDKEVCGKRDIYDESLVVGPDKGLKNAVVSVVGAKGGKFASQKVELDQRGCQYTPRVVVVPTTGQLDILNSDGILHNIHTYSTANPAINKAQPKFKKVLTEKFTKPEIIKAACDAHGWMSGWMVGTDHPFVAVTDDKGTFSIKDIPPGKYRVEVWHETLGKLVKEVSIKAREDAPLSLELAKKQPDGSWPGAQPARRKGHTSGRLRSGPFDQARGPVAPRLGRARRACRGARPIGRPSPFPGGGPIFSAKFPLDRSDVKRIKEGPIFSSLSSA